MSWEDQEGSQLHMSYLLTIVLAEYLTYEDVTPMTPPDFTLNNAINGIFFHLYGLI